MQFLKNLMSRLKSEDIEDLYSLEDLERDASPQDRATPRSPNKKGVSTKPYQSPQSNRVIKRRTKKPQK